MPPSAEESTAMESSERPRKPPGEESPSTVVAVASQNDSTYTEQQSRPSTSSQRSGDTVGQELTNIGTYEETSTAKTNDQKVHSSTTSDSVEDADIIEVVTPTSDRQTVDVKAPTGTIATTNMEIQEGNSEPKPPIVRKKKVAKKTITSRKGTVGSNQSTSPSSAADADSGGVSTQTTKGARDLTSKEDTAPIVIDIDQEENNSDVAKLHDEVGGLQDRVLVDQIGQEVSEEAKSNVGDSAGNDKEILSELGSSLGTAALEEKNNEGAKWKGQIKLETSKEKDSYFEIGQLVYCPWPGKNPDFETWYWGRITRKEKHRYAHYFNYSIEFLDGDYLESIGAKNLHSHQEYERLKKAGIIEPDDPPGFGDSQLPVETDPHEGDTEAMSSDAGVGAYYTPKELFEHRCKTCTQCTKPACGLCDVCGKLADNSECCYQKMCVNIDDLKKAQPCEGFPPRWRFMFLEDTGPTECKGVVLIAPTRQRYRTVESAVKVCHGKVDALKFCSFVGLSLSLGGAKQGDVTQLNPVGDGLTRLSTKGLFENRCRSCKNCIRDPCGECDTCIKDVGSERTMCCLRRMCCAIPIDQKKQPAPYFPEGWTFYFDPAEKRYPERDGLMILTAGTRRYRSVEHAMNQNVKGIKRSPDPRNFYKFVGLPWFSDIKVNAINMVNPVRAEATVRKGAVDGANRLNLKELLEKRCKECSNCTREPCGNCESCLRDKGATRTECCLRRMCCRIPASQKSQPAMFFPEGWYFYFDPTENGRFPSRDGLLLIAPSGRYYQTVEHAINQNVKMARTADPRLFYDFVGLGRFSDIPVKVDRSVADTLRTWDSVQDRKRLLSPSRAGHFHKRQKTDAWFASSRQTEGDVQDESDVVESGVKPYTPTELYNTKCCRCVMCVKPDCELCKTCKLNRGRTRRHKEVCLRKMCTRTPTEKKQQPIDGFPKGWFVYFAPSMDGDGSDQNGLGGMRIVAPWGVEYTSVASLKKKHQSKLDDVMERLECLYDQVGAAPVEDDHDNILLDKGFSREWINVDAQKRHACGTITKVQTNLGKHVTYFEVTYHEASRNLVNSFASSCNCTQVPKTQNFVEPCALGGHILDNQKTGAGDSSELLAQFEEVPFYVSWIVPDLVRKTIRYDSGVGLPVLTMIVRGFQLVLTAKESTIPNAGNGVFITCKALRGDKFLRLDPGELIDIGVYAPFRSEDRKEEHIFLLKNFVHQLKCEEYCFDTPGDETDTFDVTDDWTGDMHEIARRHIPAYVNEISEQGQIQTVHAKHDCEGALHYLIGHAEREDGQFQLKADGKTEQEIFVDYGERYEEVRVRKGFSRLPPHELARFRKEMEGEEYEYLAEIETFSVHDICSSIKFFSDLLVARDRALGPDVILRSLVVAILLKERARQVQIDMADVDDNDSFCDNGFSEVDMSKVVEDAGKLCTRLFDRYGNEEEMKQKLQQNELFATTLEKVLKQPDLEDLSCRELRSLVDRI